MKIRTHVVFEIFFNFQFYCPEVYIPARKKKKKKNILNAYKTQY